jgi:hypothetical protein
MNANVTRNEPGLATDGVTRRRSRQSLEFETFWRALPKEELLPHRRDFSPLRVPTLLRHFILMEMRLDDAHPSLPIRLVGTALQERIQRDVTGHDYLEFVPAELHSGAIETAKLMLHRPCGLWQITPVHYERGLAQNFEVTAFPLLNDAVPLVLGLLIPREDLVRPLSSGDKAMLADAAIDFQFLDIGAGEPGWPPH